MDWIEFSDFIGIAIVIYVAVLTRENLYLEKSAKTGILVSGVSLAILYIFDFSWYVIYSKCPASKATDFALNFVTCMVYLMLPCAIGVFYIIFIKKRRMIRYYIGLIFLTVLWLGDIVNIFYPLFFYHKNSEMIFLPLGFSMHLLCFCAFVILVWDIIVSRAFDYEDTFLAAFVVIVMIIGLLASWINYDLKTLWVALGLSYLLMYLAISAIYNKIDNITRLPNRNAFDKETSRLKDNYSTILMIDLNGLKNFNDTMGHTTGDHYIYATARTLADAFEGCGSLYRVGGDEFCLVSKKSKEVLSLIAERILMEGKCDEKYGDFVMDFAYGIGEREPKDSVTDVYNKADHLMYEKKIRMKTREGDYPAR